MSGVYCGAIRLRRELGEDDHFREDVVEVELSQQTFEEYVEPVREYFEYSKRSSAREGGPRSSGRGRKPALKGVDEVHKEGDLISPAFSGERQESRETVVIPLAFNVVGYDETRGKYLLRPFGAGRIAGSLGYRGQLEVEYLGSLKEAAAWYVPRGVIYPFALVRLFKVLYSGDLEGLLRRTFGRSYLEKPLSNTLSKLKAPKRPTIPCDGAAGGRYYVLYRRMRTFASAVLSPSLVGELCSHLGGIIIDQNVAYLVTGDEGAAYYYSAVLNYMAYKAAALRLGPFVRDQFGRPVKALAEAGLEWGGEGWQAEVSRLSRSAHGRARAAALKALGLPADTKLYELVDAGRDEQVKGSLGEPSRAVLASLPKEVEEFEEIVKLIDSNVDQGALREALENVVERRR